MSSLLNLSVAMDIGREGITLRLNAIDEELAKLIKEVEFFQVKEVSRHSMGTSDVVLVSNKGLGFIERPELEEDGTGNTGGVCGCNDTTKPLEPVVVPDSEFKSIRLLSEEGYNQLTASSINKPTYAELGYVELVSYSKEQGYTMSGNLNIVENYDYPVDGAHVFLVLEVSDYVKSNLGVLAVDSPSKVVMMVSVYGEVKNLTVSELYYALNSVNNTVTLPLRVAVKGLTTIPNIVLTADWDGGGYQKFARFDTKIDMSGVALHYEPKPDPNSGLIPGDGTSGGSTTP